MTFFFSISIIVLLLFMNSSHPITIMSLILIQTLNMCLMTWIVWNLSWFSYILFLIFLGGLMVLFIYIVSLASNEKFSFIMKLSPTMITTTFLVILMFMIYSVNNLSNFKINLSTTLIWMYSSTMVLVTMTTMIYLLLTLIVVVKMTSKYKGPMRGMIMKSLMK